MKLLTISPMNLIVGDTIVDDMGRKTKVTTLEECNRKGVSKVHVNGKYCYDSARLITVTIN